MTERSEGRAVRAPLMLGWADGIGEGQRAATLARYPNPGRRLYILRSRIQSIVPANLIIAEVSRRTNDEPR